MPNAGIVGETHHSGVEFIESRTFHSGRVLFPDGIDHLEQRFAIRTLTSTTFTSVSSILEAAGI